ncbi:MAG: FAD-binding oxidoreductase [Spirochaetes bacterium]|nr:FAD-binding oxidoreductase [Spirochaetota bacterium]
MLECKILSDKAYEEMEIVIGKENISREPSLLDSYAWQPAINLGTEPWIPRPAAVVLPQTTEEVQSIVRICNKHGIKYKAHSTGWAAWGGPGEQGVVQIDLRRMNRIIEINEKNMYAVVEPYVCCSQLQAEAMKHGLNCHIIGAGPNTSQLASVTSAWGYGWTGLYTGFGGRNPLGVEWVLPGGDLLHVGTPGSGAGWFCGDGPGPSLRGVMRGWGGTTGGLGVFTKVAVKLYPWPSGPRKPRFTGILSDISPDFELPKTHKVYFLFSKSYEDFTNVAYAIGDSEIGYIHCKGSVGAMFGLLAPRALRILLDTPGFRTIIKSFQHMTLFAIAAQTDGEFEYQEKVIKKIMDETNGILVDASYLPFHGSFWWGLHRSIYPAMAFRPGGAFITSMGSSEMYECCVKQAKIGEQLKQRFIDNGTFIDDMADCTWGGIYEGTSNWGHLEEIGMFDRRKPQTEKQRYEFLYATTDATIKDTLGFGLSSMENQMYKWLGPMMFNYHLWQARIKEAFDPNNASDGSHYVPPIKELEKDMVGYKPPVILGDRESLKN